METAPVKKELSRAAAKVCAAATRHFAEYGYGAASMSKIAEDAGIRKASIYAHFSGKDDLFSMAFSLALEEERAFLEKCFGEEKKSGEIPGFSYCDKIKSRYRQNPQFRFLLSAAYLPKNDLNPKLVLDYPAYLETLHSLFKESFKSKLPSIIEEDLETFLQTFLGIVDSLHAELIYSDGKYFDIRFKSMWKVLSDSINTARNK